MEIDLLIKILAGVVSLISGFQVGRSASKTVADDSKRRNTVEMKRKGSNESVTISTSGTKQDAKRLVDYVNRTDRELQPHA